MPIKAPPFKKITKKLRVDFISLCAKGKNFMSTLYKADKGEVVPEIALQKATPADLEKGEVRGLVYVPGKADADKDFAETDVVKAMAYDHARRGHKLDLQHDGVPLKPEQAYVAESFLVQKGDPRFEGATDVSGAPVDPVGAWGVVLKLDDEALKTLYREGHWSGLSMGGAAVREPADEVTKEDKDENMTKDEQLAFAETVAKAVATALAPKAPEKAPTQFKAPTSAKEARALAEKLQREVLEKSVKWEDPASVAEYAEALAKAEAEAEKAKASNQPLVKGKPGVKVGGEPEDEQEAMLKAGQTEGSLIAQAMNKQRGYASK
jgi:hypothetical protein